MNYRKLSLRWMHFVLSFLFLMKGARELNFRLVLFIFYLLLRIEDNLIGFILLSYWNIIIVFLILYVFIRLLCYLKKDNLDSKKEVMLIYIMGFIMMCYFFINNIFFFYLFYELSVLPIFYYICVRGERKERFQAGYFILFMTFFYSLPFVFFFFNFFLQEKIIMSRLLYLKGEMLIEVGYLICLFAYVLFLVKIPIYFFHFWLPKAHVEASVEGSIILAALLLKLGCYGLLFLRTNFFNVINNVCIIFFTVRVYCYVLVLFLCLKQRNLKKFVAYSSIFHISYVIGRSIMRLNGVWSFIIVLWIIHGITSMYLFWFLGFLYEIIFSKSIFFMLFLKGIKGKIIFLFFGSTLAVVSILPCSSFFSEIYVLMLLLFVYYLNMMFMLIIFFIAIFYILFFYMIVGLRWYKGFSFYVKEEIKILEGRSFILNIVIFLLFFMK